MSPTYNKLVQERNLLEQKLIKKQLESNDICFECQALLDEIKELKKQLKEYDKKIKREGHGPRANS